MSSVSLLCYFFLRVDIKRAIWSHTDARTRSTHWRLESCFTNDEGVCIPAPLLFHRLETLTQINRQHGPAITISVSSLLPASLHSPSLLYTRALLSLSPSPSLLVLLLLPLICLDLRASIYLSLSLPLFLSPSLCPRSHILSSSFSTSPFHTPCLFLPRHP